MSDVVETRASAGILRNPSRAQTQELNDCIEFLKLEHAKFRQNQLVLEGIEECAEDDTRLTPELKRKIQEIILGEQISQIQLESENILGVPTPHSELSYSQSNRLYNCVKSNLENKTPKVQCFSLPKSESPFELARNDKVCLDYIDKLAKEEETYIKNRLELFKLLEELKDIRLKTVPTYIEQIYQESNTNTHLNYLKSQLAKGKYRMDIFLESSHAFNAYTELMKDIKRQQQELKLKIDELAELKQKYADVDCKEYNDILRSFLRYKSCLEKKKLMYKLCN